MLSKKQQEIVETKEKYVVVMASVSAGKTRVLTERVRHLLKTGVPAHKIVVITFTNAAAGEMRRRLGEDAPSSLKIMTVHSYANYLLSRYNIPTAELIQEEDFDGFFTLIKEYPRVIQEVEHLLLDEAQDSDENQIEFLMNYVRPKNFFLVGDIRQCQPAGTKVLLRGNILKNIEDVEVGDSVVWYDQKKSYVSSWGDRAHNTIHAKVLRASSREIDDGFLVKATTEKGFSSIYTPNHKVFVRLEEGETNEIVYLMADETNRFRVGTSTLVSMGRKGNTNPWRKKMQDEGCNRIWILGAYKTRKEALLWEDKISYLYQIPQTCWQLDKTQKTQEDIDFIYEGLDTLSGAKRCLEFFHRDYNYPFLKTGDDNIHFALNAVAPCYACNIISGMMSFLVYNPELKHRKEYQMINTREDLPIKEPTKVYSLEIEKYGTYVSDFIITNNSIYSFAGSDPQLLLDIMIQKDVAVYSLNENYRNGKDILEFAKRLLSRSGLRDNAIAMTNETGEVIEMELNVPDIIRMIKNDGNFGKWFILTRTNAESERMINALMTANIPYDTFKKGNLRDDQLERKMEENTVKVLTIHTSKGLENDNVVVVGARYYNEEEYRVAYVAATRARKRLIWTSTPKKRRRRY